MLTLRRFVLAALLASLVIGCKEKVQPGGPVETSEEHRDKKIEALRKAPEGPQLRPKPE
ncbi:MAG TPA: hypothetical protein VH682_20705 [Gemmataceae bacterium]|jgi:hypothetical protein